MVRETRHLWVGNLPENIREDRIREHFKRYGRVQSVKLLPRVSEEKTGEVSMACTVAFMDIKSASKAHNAELKIDDRTLNTEYYEPAAIPSAASPQGTPPPYSTSPGSTRFPNGHGSSDEHSFVDAAQNSARFYERSSSTGGSGVNRTPSDAPSEPSRRGAATPAPEGGSGTCRGGRNRDRFRGGGQRGGASWVSGYESRYNNSNERSQSETTGYNSAPSDTNERRNSESVRKKAKSRSGSRSPTPNGSTTSRSQSRSGSRSSSSSSSSSTSRDTSSTSSRRSRRHHHRKKTAQSVADDRRPLAICVRNLPIRSSDTSLKDGLFHEYKKHGKVTWVKVVGQNADRYAIVCFKKPEDAEKALEVSYDKLFFGCKIEVAPYAVCDVDEGEYRYESEIDEYNPKATRTLFIGNLEKDVTASDLRKHFDQFGEIIEIDIKKQGAVSSYAFCQYADIVSVVKAIRKMDGEHLGNNRVKLGFGKSMAYSCVWVDGIIETVTDKYLRMQFEPFGTVTRCVIDREKGQSLVFFEHVAQAQQAVAKMRGFMMKGQKLQVDFASRECQECFFERVEKQGATLERGTFEDRREATSRGFESSVVSRLSRYDTPTRPRTSSYSSRSSVAAVASPGTPGSATPRAGRTRVSRYYDYDMEYNTIEGTRHTTHRSYDEYSQGSAASHEDPYDPYDHGVYLHDSPGHLDPLEVRVQNLVEPVPYAPHDIRNLQKERVHLLEQLEECPSSGDELISPKKRLKLDLMDPSITGDVIIETNRDHNRKVMEVRRLSESTLRHHSRRPSVDNKYGNHYAPHAVGCKRRRTGGSDSGNRTAGHSHYTEHSDGSEQGGSRPGTPLCDENPEFPPGEPPKRTPREREGPLMLPLPKFAAQIRNTPEFLRGTVSVAGIKGQKDNVNPLASPPPAATSPRVSYHQIRPPSPTQAVPPPASPPPRPPSLSSNSSDSDGSPPSPSLEERIRSLDEKYEKWSGTRTFGVTGNEVLALLGANREKFRHRHKLLDIRDPKQVQPSEIVKSVLARPSVFDEDSKRLESVGEKYEPKEFGIYCSRLNLLATSMVSTPATSTAPLSISSSTLKLTTSAAQPPKTPTVLSPHSSGTGVTIPATRGLQYPFPSHPPVQMSSVPTSSTAPTTSTTSTIVAARNANSGENRLKPTASAPGDSRTSSVKNSSVANVNSNVAKSKSSEKVSSRRNSSNTSPRADVKTRRNSDTSARRIEEAEHEEKEQQEKERRERENQLEKQRLEKERHERERLERDRVQREREKAEKELQERIRQEKEKLERERQEKEKQEKERLERLTLERLQQENQERERKEREEKERKEKEERERKERERREREERELQDKIERERREREEREQKVKEEEQHRVAKERRRSEDPTRHKDVDNHHERINKQHRENHTETKHRENNTHHANGKDESHRRDVERPRHTAETRHLSIDLEKGSDPTRRKERNNSLPATVGVKRRLSSHDQISDMPEEVKKMRFTHDYKKITERRDSKDSNKSDEKTKKIKHKNNSHDKHSSMKESEERRREREERHKKYKLEKQKAKSKSREKEAREPPLTPPVIPTLTDKDFLAKLNLKSNKDIERDKQRKEKEIKEKRAGEVEERPDDKIKKEKPPFFDTKDNTKSPQNEIKVKMEDRKGLEKHSIFEIVNEEPPYISMYDKVKARSCKNMQKQEEEKRQEKIKAKFNQLKLSRARREEKKRSTSWEEDSDSDKEVEVKSRRCRKVLDSSDESQDCKMHHRRKDQLHSDSDNSLPVRTVKTEQETTDEEMKTKHPPFKTSKSRITSDTSDDEYEKNKVINKVSGENNEKKMKEIFSENEQEIDYTDNEIDMCVPNMTYPLLLKKSSDEDIAALNEIRKDKLERRKKHKKKQKKQKHSVSSEESYKLEPEFNQTDEKEKKHHEKKKDHSKKDKKRDKTKDGRDKTKKSKKNKSEERESRREGKMENIFGSLSEDSESGQKEHKSFLVDENAQEPATFNVDSEKEPEISVHDERESEHKRKKDKKRKEKERRLQEAAAEAAAAAAEEPPNSNDNSMDFVDMGKQLEANIKDDTSEMEYKTEVDTSNLETSDTFGFTEHEIKKEKEDRKEGKEKKKKRKKSKDEKKHHHHHHSDKNKIKSIDTKSDKVIETVQSEEVPEVKVEPVDDNSFSQAGHCQSLPTILDVSLSTPKSPINFEISPSTREILTQPLISPIPSTPTSSKKEKLIPGFGTEIDESIHDNAVKSICTEFEPVIETEEATVIKEENKETTNPDPPEDKPRVVISQEETEDAVAALLGESFGISQFEERYTEDISVAVEETPPEMVEESNVQDDEEMRKAVQSLEADDDITKPDTPQSEHELQIDTDTEEQEDTPSTVDQRSKTPELPIVSETKTPETPFFQEKSTISSPVSSYKSLGSPPSLTPLKTGSSIFGEAKKASEKSESIPSEQHRSVIAQSWPSETKEIIITKPEPVADVKSQVIVSSAGSQTLLKTFVTPSVVKVSEPNYPPLAKLSPNVEIKIPSPPSQPAKPLVISQLHNLPARSPVQICKPPTSEGMLLPKSSTNIHLNRMPITPVIVSKPIQATAMYLPQPKVAHSTEPPKLISTSEPRPQDRPRMVLQTSYGNYSPVQPPRMVVQTNIKHISPGGLLVPSRHIAPISYGQFVTNVPHSTNSSYSVKESQNPDGPNKNSCGTVAVDQVKSTIVIAGTHGAPASPRTTLSTSVVINPPQLILTSPKAIQNNSTLSPLSSVSAKSPTPTANQTFVVLPSPRQSPKAIPVITESHSIVTSHMSPDGSTPLPSPPKVPILDGITRSKISEIKSVNTLTLAIQESRTSTPSPVIVPNPDIKVENSPTNISKLAIEKVTEELNMSLENNDIDKTNKALFKKDEILVKDEVKEPLIVPENIVNTPTNSVMAIESAEENKVLSEKEKLDGNVESIDPIENSDTEIKLEKDEVKIQKDEDSLETKEDKEDNDFWSANSVNIDSVIKTLGSADEMSDTDHKESRTLPCLKSDTERENQEDIPPKSPDNKIEEVSQSKAEEESDINDVSVEVDEDIKSEPSVTRSSARRGRGGRPRGSKTKTNIERGGIQTRRAKLKETLATTGNTVRRGRGGKIRTERKSSKSESDLAANDVYEFRDDSDDNNKEQRPRLVLTIKSTTSSTSNLQATAIIKEIPRDGAKEIIKETKDLAPLPLPNKPAAESKEEFSLPQTNTRKSRRLAEKDITRNTVDDTIEDVIKNTPQTRSVAGQRRSGRQVKKPQPLIAEPDSPRKSLRGRKPLRRGSEAAETSSSEETREEQQRSIDAPVPKLATQTTVLDVERPSEKSPQPEPKKVDHCSLKTAMLKRFKGEMNSLGKPEPTNLIDPVTGVLTPMRESEEGKYIPLPGSSPSDRKSEHGVMKSAEITKASTQAHQVTVVQQPAPKIHPLKAHVLSSQAAKAVIEQAPQVPVASQSAIIVNNSTTSAVITRSGTPITLNTNTSGSLQTVGPLSPRPGIPVAVTSKPQVKPPVLSPSQQLLHTNQKHLLSAREQHLSQQSGTVISSSLPSQQVQMVNTHIAHIKHRHDPQVIIGAKSPNTKSVHQPHLTGPVAANPPITKGPTSRIVQGPSQAANKGVMEPPKVDVNFGLGRPSLSPSSGPQARLPGLPVPAYEASLGEPMPHFQPGSLRPALTAHYMHQQQVIQYQQYLRHQQLHFQRPTNLEKSGEEGEEAPVGLALSGRGAAVPHHSPHDRATESPAIGQVYNTLPHSARLPPYHPGTRYYEPQSTEPPPAHRPLTSHDRAGLPHIPPLSTSDRPLGAHTAHSSSHLVPDRTPVTVPERPLSAHLVHDRTSLNAPERPHTAYGHPERPIVGTSLGAAGNIMGAMAKHIGVDAPASQRGIQAATPPLASQVPPQAESLFMLLKQYPLLWQGLLALKNDQAAVQMYFVSGNEQVAKCSLPKNTDGSTPPLRIFQRMRLEQPQVEGVARKMQMENEHCMLLALPCGHDPIDVLKQSTNLNMGFITYLQLKQAAGIVNVAAPGTTQPPAYVVHIFPSCDFVNENLRRIAPSLLERVADIAHLLIVITTV